MIAFYALVSAALSSLAALLTSFFVFFQVQQSNRHSRISVLMSFQERFATEDMAKAIRSLYEYKEEHGKDFAQKFANDLRANTGDIESINYAR